MTKESFFYFGRGKTLTNADFRMQGGTLSALLIHSFYNFNFYAPANAMMAASLWKRK